MIAVVFVTSGWSHVTKADERAKSIGQSEGFTTLLGIAEFVGDLGIAIGIWPQLAAAGLILIMLGAIGDKLFVWHTGFWGEKASGWQDLHQRRTLRGDEIVKLQRASLAHKC